MQAEFNVARGDASLPYTLGMVGFAFGGVLMGRVKIHLNPGAIEELKRSDGMADGLKEVAEHVGTICRAPPFAHPAFFCGESVPFGLR
mgnify:CR=1 FL=1